MTMKRLGTMIALVVALLVGFATPSLASTQTVADALEGGKVYVSQAASQNVGSTPKNISDDMAVAVVSMVDMDSQTLDTFANNAKSQSSTDAKVMVFIQADSVGTIVLARDGVDAKKIREIIGNDRSAQGKLKSIGDKTDEINDVISQANKSNDSENEEKSSSDGPSPVLGIIIPFIISVIPLIVIAVVMVVKKQKNDDNEEDMYSNSRSTPNDIASKLTDLSLAGRVHEQMSTPPRSGDGIITYRAGDIRLSRSLSLAPFIKDLVNHTNSLFERLEKKGSQSQKNMATVEYRDKLSKILKAVGNDYYLDIALNPKLWNDAENRLNEVKSALVALDEQVITNIRQVNENQDIEFQVALESLIRDTENVNDIYKEG